jgi:predicted dinucleotide-binding enzyme
VPGTSVADVFETVTGWDGKTVIDATNLVGARPPDGFASNAKFIKARTNGLTAKSFNLNFARLFDQIDRAKNRPSNIWSGDEEAREVVEQLIRDAGYDPMYAGGMDKTSAQEQAITLILAISRASGPYFYRMAAPDEL